MAISKDLLLAILSMDAYNQGYTPGLVHGKSQIGTAMVGDDSGILVDNQGNPVDQDSSFYAVEYDDATYGKIISYRIWGHPLEGSGQVGARLLLF